MKVQLLRHVSTIAGCLAAASLALGGVGGVSGSPVSAGSADSTVPGTEAADDGSAEFVEFREAEPGSGEA